MAKKKFEKVDDDALLVQIESGVKGSTGTWLNSSDLTRERRMATHEYAGLATGHLSPEGVSGIVSSDTTETIEAYLAVISELMLNNEKIARFTPYDQTPAALKSAQYASDIVNYCVFKKNNGWTLLNTWIKASLLWKNAIIRWDYVEDFKYEYEEFDEISQESLDEKLGESDVEIAGELFISPRTDGVYYSDVRLKKKIDKSRVKIENIPQEGFRISRDATSLDDAAFVGIELDLTRSEIRSEWPDIAKDIDDWDDLGDENWSGEYSEEIAARKQITGQNYNATSSREDNSALEASQIVTVTECWIRVDRDGDGIAELKHIIVAGDNVLFEEDVDSINLASICPFEVPYEFFGLSVADMTRSSTLASTAILRGFVENTYLTNYSPRLADPNVVDFSALQNMKPKDIIATNGNPQGAVTMLQPETISTGTVPLLQHLQIHKEQATGMSKAAQGLNDELYVSGNSETKLAMTQTAAQKRIQHIARIFAETGFKRLAEGVYSTMRRNMKKAITPNYTGVYAMVDIDKLPNHMDMIVDVDLGENSNANKRSKLTMIATQLLPMVKEGGQEMILRPDVTAALANNLLSSMDENPLDYLEDYNSEEFKEKAKGDSEKKQKEAEEAKKLATEAEKTQMDLAKANVNYTNVQASNAIQDNTKQLAVAIDRHFQEWEKLRQDALKDELPPPQMPNMEETIKKASAVISGLGKPQDSGGGILDDAVRKMGIEPEQAMQMMQKMMQGGPPQ